MEFYDPFWICQEVPLNRVCLVKEDLISSWLKGAPL